MTDIIREPLFDKDKYRKVKDSQPCDKHTACYAHKFTPCEGCGRTNMQGEVWVRK